MRLLITGGTGYLGAELVRQAVASGWDVAATHFRQHPGAASVRWLPLDIRSTAAVEQTFVALRPELVIHTAYRQSGPELWPATAVGAGTIARAAHSAGAQLIHLSSDALFDGERTGRYTEQDDPSPITPYGEAKAAAERLVADQHPAALIVRTSLIYGGATPSAHEQLAIDAAAGRADIAFFTDELRCPIAVSDLAAALLELAALGRRGRLHVAGPEVVSRYDFARAVVEAYGGAAGRLRAGLSAASCQRRPRNCALDSSPAQRLIKIRLRGVHEVLSSRPSAVVVTAAERLTAAD